MSKTGTSSLRQALVRLGYNHSDMRRHFTHNYFDGNFSQIFKTAESFDSFEDWPWPLMYRRLFEEYGDGARFILTRRHSAQAWLTSLKAHVLVTNPDNNPRKRIYSFDYPHGAEAQHIPFYEAHLVDVRAYFASQNANHLLCEVCWEDGDGWSQVCDFLDAPLPSGPFPHANPRAITLSNEQRVAENKKRIAVQVKRLTESQPA